MAYSIDAPCSVTLHIGDRNVDVDRAATLRLAADGVSWKPEAI